MEGLILILGCVFIFALIMHLIATHRERGTGGADPFGRLVLACLGDRGKAQRLVEYEQSRDPQLSRDQAIRRALDRLSYDRSR